MSVSPNHGSLVVRNVRLGHDAPLVEVHIEGGSIRSIGPAGARPVPAGASVEDGAGSLILPGMVDAHCHLDKTL